MFYMDMQEEENKDPEQFESLSILLGLEREKEREREIQLERGKEWGMQAPPHHIKYTNIYVCVHLQHEEK